MKMSHKNKKSVIVTIYLLKIIIKKLIVPTLRNKINLFLINNVYIIFITLITI